MGTHLIIIIIVVMVMMKTIMIMVLMMMVKWMMTIDRFERGQVTPASRA